MAFINYRFKLTTMQAESIESKPRRGEGGRGKTKNIQWDMEIFWNDTIPPHPQATRLLLVTFR